MSRSKTRRGIRSIARNDSPDLSGIDMSSLAVRYILLTATIPDGLFPDEVVEGMIKTLNTETRTGPPWLKMHSHQVFPGDVVDIDSMLPGVLSEHEVDYFLDAVDDEQARRVASILLQRVERIDELAAAEAEQEAEEAAEDEAAAVAGAHATVTRLNAECGVPVRAGFTSVPLDEV